MPAVPRCLGIPQATDRLPKITSSRYTIPGLPAINLYKKYPESLKLVHLLPAAFTLGVAIFLLGTPFCPYSLLPIALYALLVCMDSTIRNRSLSIGLYSVAASFIQLIGYGTGFLRAWWNRCILGKDEFEAFKKNFYK